MKKIALSVIFPAALALILAACATAYEAKPLPFKAPSAYANRVEVAGAQVAAEAFTDPQKAKEVFGFDVRGAGFLPVQVVFDNRGDHRIRVDEAQTFLEDEAGNLWPILAKDLAEERAARFSEGRAMMKEGAKDSLYGAIGGALIGAAVGIVTGEGVGATAGKGAAVGAATGATMGGASKLGDREARNAIVSDLHSKSLENRVVPPQGLAFGVIFFPGEAKTAKALRLRLIDLDARTDHAVTISLIPQPAG